MWPLGRRLGERMWPLGRWLGKRTWPLGRWLGERMWPLGRRAEDFVLWGCSDSRMLESLSILHLRDGYRTDGRFVRLRLKPALGLRPLSLRQNTKGFLHPSIVTAPQDKVFRPAVPDRSWDPLDGQLAGTGPGALWMASWPALARVRSGWLADRHWPGCALDESRNTRRSMEAYWHSKNSWRKKTALFWM